MIFLELIKKSLSFELLKNTIPIFLFLYLISAINNPPFLYASTLIYKIKFILGVSPILIFGLSAFILFQNKKKIHFNGMTIFFCLFLLYCIFQIPAIFFDSGYSVSHFIYTNSLINKVDGWFNIDRVSSVYWIIATMSLPLFLYAINIFDSSLNNRIYYSFLIVIGIVTTFYLSNLFLGHFSNNTVNFSFYGNPSLDPNQLLFDSAVPRSSGMARYCIVLFILFHVIHDNYEFKNKKNKIIIMLLVIFMLFLTIHLQSRIVIAFTLIYSVFYLMPFHKENFLKRLKNILLIFNIALILHIIFPVVGAKIKFSYLNKEFNELKIHSALHKIILLTNKDNATIKRYIENKVLNDKKDFSTENNIEGYAEDKISDTENYTLEDENVLKVFSNYSAYVAKGRFRHSLNNSGRISLWNKAKQIIYNYPFFGRGPQADKKYLAENVSNLYIYSMICGGLFAFLSLVIFCLFIIFKCFKETFILCEFKKKGNILKKFSLYCLGFLFIRSIAENSFGIFGVDYFLFFLAANTLMFEKV